MKAAVLAMALLAPAFAGMLTARADEAPPGLVVEIGLQGTKWSDGYVRDQTLQMIVNVTNPSDTQMENGFLQLETIGGLYGFFLGSIPSQGMVTTGWFAPESYPDAPGTTFYANASVDAWDATFGQQGRGGASITFHAYRNALLSWGVGAPTTSSSRPVHRSLEPLFLDYQGADPDDTASAVAWICKQSYEETHVRVTLDWSSGLAGNLSYGQAESNMTLLAGQADCQWATISIPATIVGPYFVHITVTPDLYPGMVNDPSDDTAIAVSQGYEGTPQPEDVFTFLSGLGLG